MDGLSKKIPGASGYFTTTGGGGYNYSVCVEWRRDIVWWHSNKHNAYRLLSELKQYNDSPFKQDHIVPAISVYNLIHSWKRREMSWRDS